MRILLAEVICREASAGVSGRSALRQRGVSKHERDETTGAVPSTTPRPGEVVCHHPTPQTGRIIFLNPPYTTGWSKGGSGLPGYANIKTSSRKTPHAGISC